MRVAEVKKLAPLDRFVYWIRERHQIHLRRKAGKPKPWTDDEVMLSFFFTNPYRENDKVTQWFRDNIREPLRDDPKVLMATVIFRWFNYIPTGEVLRSPRFGPSIPFGLLEAWDKDQALQILGGLRDSGKQIFTGAFMINSPPGVPKLEAIIKRINNVWEAREFLVDELTRGAYERKSTLRGAHELLTEFDGLGGFMAYEIVCDLRYTALLEHAVDKLTWSNPGPGAIRGIYRILNRDFKKGNNSTSPKLPGDWKEQTTKLLEVLQKRLPKMPTFEMREVEHSLCEWDKYERMLWGDGRAKRTYNGTRD